MKRAPRLGTFQELDALLQVFSPSLVNTFMCQPLNLHLEETVRSNKLGLLQYDDMIRYIVTWALHGARLSIRQSNIPNIDDKNLLDPIGKTRYDTIHAAFSEIALSIDKYALQLGESIQQMWSPAETYASDESMFSYHGADMISVGDAMNLPGKPYPFGMLCFATTMPSKNSGLSIPVVMLPRFGSEKVTPAEAMKRMIRLVSKYCRAKGSTPTFIVDSGYPAREVIEECDRLNVHVVISVSKSQSGASAALSRFLFTSLKEGESRSAIINGVLYEAFRDVAKDHFVATTRIPWETIERQARIMSFDEAVATWKSWSLATCHQVFSQLIGRRDSVYAYACDLCGCDVALPKPDARGVVVLNRSRAGDWTKPMLEMTAKNLGVSTAGTKEALLDRVVKFVERNSEGVCEGVRVADHSMDGLNLAEQEQRLFNSLPPISTNHVAVDFYNHHYNGVDHYNRNLYTKHTVIGSKTAKGTLAHAITWSGFWAAFVYMVDLKIQALLPSYYGQRVDLTQKEMQVVADEVKATYRYEDFVRNLREQLPRSVQGRPKKSSSAHPSSSISREEIQETISTAHSPSKGTKDSPPMSRMSSLVKDLRGEINAHQSHRQIATSPSVTIFTASPDITETSETSMAVDLQSSTPAVAVPIRTTPAILTPTPRPCARVRTSPEKVEKSQRSSQSAKERRKKERRKVRTAKQNAEREKAGNTYSRSDSYIQKLLPSLMQGSKTRKKYIDAE